MKRENICPKCAFAISQKDNSWSKLGLVDCPKKGYGNAYQTECEHYIENANLRLLMDNAIIAIKEFDRINALYTNLDVSIPSIQHEELVKAAAHSCAMTEAYAIMVGIGYDMAAEYLHREEQNNG